MFRSYYGLAFNPFDKQMAREKDRFLSKDISEMLSRLDYLKDTRGIGLFTARPGIGKSFALRCFAKSLNPNLSTWSTSAFPPSASQSSTASSAPLWA